VVRVFAAASELGDGAACSAMVEQWSSVAARGGGEGNEIWTGELVGQAGGGFKQWPAVPGRPRHVAYVVRWPVTGGATRRLFSKTG